MLNNESTIMDSLTIPGQVSDDYKNLDVSPTILPDVINNQPRHELHREATIRKSKTIF